MPSNSGEQRDIIDELTTVPITLRKAIWMVFESEYRESSDLKRAWVTSEVFENFLNEKLSEGCLDDDLGTMLSSMAHEKKQPLTIETDTQTYIAENIPYSCIKVFQDACEYLPGDENEVIAELLRGKAREVFGNKLEVMEKQILENRENERLQQLPVLKHYD